MKCIPANPHYKYCIRYGEKYFIMLKKAPQPGQTFRRKKHYIWKEIEEDSSSDEEPPPLKRTETLTDDKIRAEQIAALKKKQKEDNEKIKQLEKESKMVKQKTQVRENADDLKKVLNGESIDDKENEDRIKGLLNFQDLNDSIAETVKEQVLTTISEILFKDEKPDYGESKNAEYFTVGLGLNGEVYNQMMEVALNPDVASGDGIVQAINTALANGQFKHRQKRRSSRSLSNKLEREVNDLVGCFIMDKFENVYQVCDGRPKLNKYYISPTELVDWDRHSYKLIILSKAQEHMADPGSGEFFLPKCNFCQSVIFTKVYFLPKCTFCQSVFLPFSFYFIFY